MNGLIKLGTVLTVVFLVFLLALVTEILYILWRRQNFLRRSDPFYTTPSKERLLYLFCWKNQSRVDTAGNPQVPESEDSEGEAAVVVDDDLAKWQLGVYGPSRVLSTIKEEEREGTETENENDLEVVKSSTKTVCIVEVESESSVCDEEVVVRIETVDEATPFSTPCASPPYCTPSPSRTHDKFSPVNEEGLMMVSKGENDVSFVRLELCSE